MKKLVLVSADFPFGRGGDNNFLKNEIKPMTDSFEKISVVSTGNGEMSFDLPNCFSVTNVPLRQIRITKFFAALIELFLPRTRTEVRKIREMYGKNIRYIKICGVIFKYYYAYLCLKKVLIAACKDSEIAYSFWLSSRAYALARLKKEGKINCKVISRAHGFDVYLERGLLPFRAYISNYIDEIHFISEDGKTYYETRIQPFISGRKALTRTDYLGIASDGFPCFDLPQHDELRIVTCSSIVSVKRLDILIRALASIDRIKIEWTHFGDGPDAASIKQLAAHLLGRKGNIRYRFAGQTQNNELIAYYASEIVDLFVNSSDSEGIPVSIMEAFSFGIPCICRDVGGNREINIDSTGCYLITGGEKELAQAIVNYSQLDENVKKARRKTVYQIFQNRFSEKALESYFRNMAEDV